MRTLGKNCDTLGLKKCTCLVFCDLVQGIASMIFWSALVVASGLRYVSVSQHTPFVNVIKVVMLGFDTNPTFVALLADML
jgi:hypothetical protein